ncbi:MAG: regulatory protein ArsR [Acidimicrobiaceae bacterium]|nr:MAG: regulatory protein ArsR [Acidimicrobiaceae bacterium]
MLDSTYMAATAQPLSMDAVAKALSDGTRRSILRLVRDDERSAGELAAAFPAISRPAVSQHLRVLHDARLVAVRPVGNHRMYRATTEGLAEMRQFLDEMWGDRLMRLKLAAEQAEWPERQRRRSSRARSS